jgi:hypothetical protein
MSAASPKRKLIWWALAGMFAVLLAVMAVWWTQNRAEIASADFRSLAAMQSRDRSEAILFASRKQMLETERNYIVGGFGLALAGLLGSLYAARKAGRAG